MPTVVVDDAISEGNTFKIVNPTVTCINPDQEVLWAVLVDWKGLANWTVYRH